MSGSGGDGNSGSSGMGLDNNGTGGGGMDNNGTVNDTMGMDNNGTIGDTMDSSGMDNNTTMDRNQTVTNGTEDHNNNTTPVDGGGNSHDNKTVDEGGSDGSGLGVAMSDGLLAGIIALLVLLFVAFAVIAVLAVLFRRRKKLKGQTLLHTVYIYTSTSARMRSEGYCSCPVCVCFRGPHLQLTQLSDKVGILAVSVSCWIVFKKGVFRITAFWRS